MKADKLFVLDWENGGIGVVERDIIETCKSYAEGQRAILRIYMKLYME